MVVELQAAAPAVVPVMPISAPTPQEPGKAIVWLEVRADGSAVSSPSGGGGPLGARLRWLIVGSVLDGLLEDLGRGLEAQVPGSRRRIASSDAATSWMARPTLLKTVMASGSRVAQ